MDKIRLGVHGAAGRMGKRLIVLADADPRFELVAAVDRSDHPHIGQDAGRLAGIDEIGIPLASVVRSEPQVMIDFTMPEAALEIARWCQENNVGLVAATTGMDQEQKHAMGATAEFIPLLWAPNMSLAVNLAIQLSASAAETLSQVDQDVDVEVIERHHRYKEDAPSGTALWFGEIIAARMGQTSHRHGRHGRIGQRPAHEIGYHALRVGDNPGEHTVVFGLLGESIEVTVRATSRDSYALGALEAAAYLAGKPAGLYGMADVLGLGVKS